VRCRLPPPPPPLASFPSPFRSNYCDEGDGQFLDEVVEDGTVALDADDDDESKSSDSEHEYAQFKPLIPAPVAKLSGRDNACRSAILLLHARVVVRAPSAMSPRPVFARCAARNGRCSRVNFAVALQSVLGRKSNRVWSAIIHFMNLPSISLTLSTVRRPLMRALRLQ
jgi:hypothetical protein